MANRAYIEIRQTRQHGTDGPFWIEVSVQDDYSQAAIGLGYENDLQIPVPANDKELFFLVLDNRDDGQEGNTIGDLIDFQLDNDKGISMQDDFHEAEELKAWKAEWEADQES